MTDQLGRKVNVDSVPKRIISVVPSITELLFDLGLGERVVARTKFCIHPEEALLKPKIGGTKTLKTEAIRALQPDLIIANKEENLKEDLEILMEDFPTYVSDIKTVEDAIQMIDDVGKLCACEKKAASLIRDIQVAQSRLKKPLKEAIYLIWRDPYMSVGGDTFIHDMMPYAGYSNLLASKTRYPELSEEDLRTLNPSYVLLSSEPYPFKEKHIEEIKAILPKAQVLLVDGELYSWYGSKMLKAFTSFNNATS